MYILNSKHNYKCHGNTDYLADFRISEKKKKKLIHDCEIPRSYTTRALRMGRIYKLSTDKTKQGSWPTI